MSQTILTSAPLWLAGAGATFLLLLFLFVGYLVRLIVRHARAEDLPQVLTGISQLLAALTGLLPWSRPSAPDDRTLVRRPDR